MGAAGDMIMAALLELHTDPDDFIKRLNNVGIPNVIVSREKSVKCGITGTKVRVKVNGREEESHDHHHEHHGHDHSHDHEHHHHHHEHDHHHEHSHSHAHTHDKSGHAHGSFDEIKHLISHLAVSDVVKENILSIYNLIAEAESHAHGVPVTQVHFHEVGEMDAVADITGVCMLMEALAPEKIVASPVNVGSGHVKCSHGILPVPAPATAFIMKGVPIYSDPMIKGELCTPTGAAILKHFASEFRTLPEMNISEIGYGMGTKDFAKANCVRAFIGESENHLEDVVELACNIDDMTAEAIAYAQKVLMQEGALDVYTSPIGMKKGRAGLLFTCMCRIGDKEKMLKLMFKHTSTLGVREYASRRYTLKKEHSEVKTKYGSVRIKTSSGYGVKKTKLEHEDIAKIADDNNISIAEVHAEIMKYS